MGTHMAVARSERAGSAPGEKRGGDLVGARAGERVGKFWEPVGRPRGGRDKTMLASVVCSLRLGWLLGR
jgi:hypothetical protein